jgi:hypothetical protein
MKTRMDSGRQSTKVSDTRMDLPSDVKNAIHAGRKIDAIKLLRTHHNLGLKEAKEIVDAYMDQNRVLIGHQRAGRESGIGRLLVIIILGGVIYAAYRAFS